MQERVLKNIQPRHVTVVAVPERIARITEELKAAAPRRREGTVNYIFAESQ